MAVEVTENVIDAGLTPVDGFARQPESHEPLNDGAGEVVAAFLAAMETWRDVLARNIALRNPDISERDLNFAVQRTIDRTVFLRICEDRGIEPYGTLQALVNGPNVYRRLGELFQRADERYNSGLFHFSAEKDRTEPPDELTLALAIDDKPLRDIIESLYYPESPYEFSVLPAEILGQVYEQFLGKVIRLTKGHQARVEEKPEVRKAGGVYYTPAYIVDYIVEHTVVKLLEGKTPAQAAKLRVLDPACGSGSFLIGAYQRLLDWHRDQYVADDAEKHARARNPRLYRGAAGEWRLTTAERKRILLNNVYGVDIDPQAVEVTKLSLLLKVLEGESKETVNNQLRFFHRRALPDLGRNVKCGNSLVGPDFYEGRQKDIFDQETVYRINAFDWEEEFRDILRRECRGFDAVIGNPPYVRMEAFKPIKDYLRKKYAAHEERADLYTYFVEKGLSLLGRAGVVAMIVSNKFIRAKYGKPLRRLLVEEAAIETIADFAGANVFGGATVRTVVLVARPRTDGTRLRTQYVPVPDPDTVLAFAAHSLRVEDYARHCSCILSTSALSPDVWHLAPRSQAALLEKLAGAGKPLAERAGIRALFGMKTGFNTAFIIDEAMRKRLVRADRRSGKILRPILFGRDVRRYHLVDAGRFVIWFPPECRIQDYPAIRDHLLPFRKTLQRRAGGQDWHQLQQPAIGLVEHLQRPKIVYPIIANECRFTLDVSGYFINDKLFILPTDDLALLALLNSGVANFYFSAVCAALEGARERYLEFRAQYVDCFPVPAGFLESSNHETLVAYASQMLRLHKRMADAKTAHEKTVLKRQIAATDDQIDHLVYEVYGLSDGEIRLVEQAAAGTVPGRHGPALNSES